MSAPQTPAASDAYEPLTIESLEARLSHVSVLRQAVGPAPWRCREVGDGNLNLVFIVEGAAGAAVVKQALPYVRLVGDSWPLSLTRAFFEFHALTRQTRRDPGRVPEILHYDQDQALIVMEYLQPHLILRKHLIAGVVLPDLARDMGLFCARTLFRGSDLSMPTAEKKADVALFAGNTELCDITENLVFTDPYFDAPMNRHTTPQLDRAVASLRADQSLKIEAQALKALFCNNAETMLHGDLHTGSIMATESDTRVIDPEFAVYGPMGFDLGMLLANFLMAYYAQDGHAERPGARDAYKAWILEVVSEISSVFEAEFSALWRAERDGILYPDALYRDQGHEMASERALRQTIERVWCDAMGFLGVEIHRRILGLAHIEEYESIEDPERRAPCEARGLELGRAAVLNRRTLSLSGLLLLTRRLDDVPTERIL